MHRDPVRSILRTIAVAGFRRLRRGLRMADKVPNRGPITHSGGACRTVAALRFHSQTRRRQHRARRGHRALRTPGTVGQNTVGHRHISAGAMVGKISHRHRNSDQRSRRNHPALTQRCAHRTKGRRPCPHPHRVSPRRPRQPHRHMRRHRAVAFDRHSPRRRHLRSAQPIRHRATSACTHRDAAGRSVGIGKSEITVLRAIVNLIRVCATVRRVRQDCPFGENGESAP